MNFINATYKPKTMHVFLYMVVGLYTVTVLYDIAHNMIYIIYTDNKGIPYNSVHLHHFLKYLKGTE